MNRIQIIREVLALARRKGSVLTRAEILTAGATPRLLAELAKSGVLIRVHPGVYVVAGATGDPRVAIRAAIAAIAAPTMGGTGARACIRNWAVASHGTAAWLQGIIERPPAAINVTASVASSRRLSGVIVHRSREPIRPLPYQGIRCTPPVWTLVDLAAIAPPTVVERAVDRALATGLLRITDIEVGLAEQVSGRRGSGQLRTCLLERGYVGGPTPSVLESDMGRLLKRMGLPVPKAEVHAGPDGQYRIDYVYGSRRVAIEVYGYTWHHSPEQLKRDMSRQRGLTLEGWTVLVYTWLDVQRDPERIAAEISSALAVMNSGRS